MTEFIADIFLRISPRLRALAGRMSMSDAETDDALQDSFVRLWRHRDSLDSGHAVEGLAVSAMRSVCVDTIRRRKVRIGNGSIPADGQNFDSADNDLYDTGRDELLAHVNTIIDSSLTPVQRQVLLLRDREGLEFDRIAEITGLAPATVRATLSRARKAVRNIYLQSSANDTYHHHEP